MYSKIILGRLKSAGFNERLETLRKLNVEDGKTPIYHLEAAFELLNS